MVEILGEVMKKVKMKDLEKLEKISIGLDRIPKEKSNRIIEDMKWLVCKLRESFVIIEDLK